MPGPFDAQQQQQQGEQQGGDQQQPQQGAQASKESQFADLAFSFLREKAPKLMEHMVGFQVLDKSEDDNRMAGVFGFKVGKEKHGQRYYTMVMFMNGELKGYEVLYVPDQDICVPLQENWVTYLLNRRPPVTGMGVPQNEWSRGSLRPDLSVFSRSPMTFGKANECLRGYWTRGDLFDITPLLLKLQQPMNDPLEKAAMARLDLSRVREELGLRAMSPLLNSMREDPKFASVAMKFYDFVPWLKRRKQAAVLDGGVAEVKGKPFKSTDPDTGTVTIIREDGAIPLDTLQDSERETLLAEGIVIRDNRTGAAHTYKLDTPTRLDRPSENGLFEICVSPSKFERMLVVQAPRTIGKGESNGVITLVRLDHDNQYTNTSHKAVLARKQLLTQDWKPVYEKLGEVGDLAVGDRAMLILPNGEATRPFRVADRETGPDGTLLWVDPDEYVSNSRADVMRFDGGHGCCGSPCESDSKGWQRPAICHVGPTVNRRPDHDDRAESGDWWKSSCRAIRLSPDASKFTAIGSTLLAPEKCKAVKLSSSKRFDCELGTLADLQALMFKQAGVTQLDVYAKAGSWQVCGKHGQTAPRGWADTLTTLVRDYGIYAPEARTLAKAAKADGHARTFITKAAYGVDDPPTSPPVDILDDIRYEDPSWMAPVVPSLGIRQRVNPTLDNNRELYNPDTRLDPDTMRGGGNAARATGQKDVFDTSVLGGLLKQMDSGDVIDRYLTDISKGLDRKGRMLLMFYWHRDKFAERYGPDEMKELEDSLRNNFKGDGDLVLFLKKKAVEPDSGMRGGDVDLDDSEG